MTNDNQKETAVHRHARQGLGRRVAIIVAAGAFLLTPTSARAGEYVQHFCNSGPGSPSANAWYGIGSEKPADGCNAAAGYPWNGVYYVSSKLHPNGYAGLRADAPAGARYKTLGLNLRVPYQAQNRRTYVSANWQYVFSWWNGWGGTSSYNPDGNTFTIQLDDAPFFEIGQACHGSDAGGCAAGDFWFSGALAVLRDITPPAVSADLGSPIFDPARTVFRGSAYAEADLVDDGHGIATGSVKVDGADIPGGSEDFRGSCNYRLPSPCASRHNWGRHVDTSRFSDGIHTVRVTGDDGMGQATYTQRTVTFDNTPPALEGKAPFDGQTHTGDGASFPVSASDPTSGVKRIELSVDGGPWSTLVEGATGTVSLEGAGTRTVRVRAVDVAGNVSPEQVSTFTVQAPPEDAELQTGDGAPLPGAPGPGDTVKCHVGGPWSEGTTFTFRWLRDGAPIDGATGQTYTLVTGDAGRSIVCEITANNAVGETIVVTDPVETGTEPCFGAVGPTEPCGDNDGDGDPNATDPDDDGDGVLDGDDPAPFDPDVPGDPNDGAGGSGVAAPATSPIRGGEAAAPALGVPNNGVNASNRAKITLDGARRRRVAFGRRIATVAHLRDENGRPITGAQVTVLERMNVPGGQWVPARAPLVSDARGRLRWVIPAKFSRTIRYAYKANLANADFQSTSDVVLTVYSRSTLKASKPVLRNGQTVAFRGRLKSKPIPRGGVLIDLQARVGSRWQTFKTTRARTSGRWQVKYRFRSTRGVRVYSFRARVRQDSGYPYAISKTRAVRVKVIG